MVEIRKGDRVRVTPVVQSDFYGDPLRGAFESVALDVTSDEYGTYVRVATGPVAWDESQVWVGWASTLLDRIELVSTTR